MDRIITIGREFGSDYEFYTGKQWGEKHNYDFCINTERLDIKSLAAQLAGFIEMEMKNV